MRTAYRVFVAALLYAAVLPGRGLGAEGVNISASAAYRFDGIAAHIWESDASLGVSARPGLELGATFLYVDATQEPIQCINRLRGQVITGLADVSWRTIGNRLQVDAKAGVDCITGWKVMPTGEISLKALLPMPLNPVFQNLALAPKGWYRHRMPNGPAIRNHVASYGWAAELGAAMGPKGAIAVNFQQEFLKPYAPVLDTSFLESWPGGTPLDTLETNTVNSFYAYIYRQVLPPLYVGYAFSYMHTAIDRRVATYSQPVAGTGIPPVQGTVFKWAYYPYPTPQNMLAHIISATADIHFGPSVAWKSTAAVPAYSRQRIRYLPAYLHFQDQLSNYPYTEEKFTGPLTLSSGLTWNISTRTALALSYDFFGFPYKSWAYFTKDSYSLHTLKLGVKQCF